MASTQGPFSVGSILTGTISNIVDAAGNPTTFKSPPVWSSSDTSIFAPVAAADGLTAQGTVLKLGTVTITVVGDGVTETVTLNTAAGVVAGFAVTFTAQGPPAPPPGA